MGLFQPVETTNPDRLCWMYLKITIVPSLSETTSVFVRVCVCVCMCVRVSVCVCVCGRQTELCLGEAKDSSEVIRD